MQLSSLPSDLCFLHAGNIWEEPWEQETALATIRKIERHWHQLDNRNSSQALQRSPADAAGLAEEGSGAEDSVPSRQQQADAGAGANMVCNHIACSAQQFCVVEQLQTVRDNYRGRVDQFRIKVRLVISVHVHGSYADMNCKNSSVYPFGQHS